MTLQLRRYKTYTTMPWKHAFVITVDGVVVATSPSVFFMLSWPIARVKAKARQYGFSFAETQQHPKSNKWFMYCSIKGEASW